jgi:predicted MPP superfamily phosphohydrolase
MSLGVLSLSLIAVGHACLAATAINVVHGLGVNWKRMERAVLVGLGVLAAVTLGLAAVVARGDWASWPWPVRAYAALCVAVGGVGLPAVTLARWLRTTPPGIAGRATEIDLARVLGPEERIGPGRHAWCLRLPGNESFRLRFEDWSVEVPGLPPALDGLGILHLTDLHFAPCFDRRFFEAVADEVARAEVDLVVCTGDLVDDDGAIAWIGPILGRVRGRLGQFAILGNHDVHHRPDLVRRELIRAGFEDVDGRWTALDIDGTTLAIGGTSAPWGPRLDLDAAPEADFRLVLSHTPDLFPRLAAKGVELTLSGHNHGGQVRLPVLGPVLMPSRFGRRFDLGFFRSGRSLLYVGRGVAGKHPIRYNCPPEVARLVLRAAPTLRHARRGATTAVGQDSQI